MRDHDLRTELRFYLQSHNHRQTIYLCLKSWMPLKMNINDKSVLMLGNLKIKIV